VDEGGIDRRGAVEIGRAVRFGRHCVLGGLGAKTVVADECTLGESVRLEAGVQLEARCRIGDFTCIGHPSKAATVGLDVSASAERVRDLLVESAETRIAADGLVRSHSIIYSHVRIGPRLSTGHHVLIREHTSIGARCVFGSYASCDGYSRLGNDVQVGQGAYLAQAARIGDGVFIGAQVVFADNRRAVRDPAVDLFGPVLEDYVRIGHRCVLLAGTRIGSDALVGAGSVVTRDIPPGTLAMGSPCRVVRDLTADETHEYRASVRRAHATPEAL
jgi:acetyltransferase-like isoleucine patch superfamily enzyme